MYSLNQVQLIGNLGRDPEVRHSQAGDQIVSLSLATSEKWRDKQSGDVRQRTEWHRVVVFNEKLGDVIAKYARKGSKLFVSGKLVTRKWTDKDGIDRYSTEVQLGLFNSSALLLDKIEKADSDETAPPPADNGADLDDDIPF